MGKATREEVYQAIDSERDYQDQRWNPTTTTSGGLHPVPSWILYMQRYLDKAAEIASTTAEPRASEEALEFIRKVTGMGVACMEQHGAPLRSKANGSTT